jgi:2-polyprenyl-3-methyl-5-hydroxy-6-metoxy-1,4-benzoquinol methylase
VRLKSAPEITTVIGNDAHNLMLVDSIESVDDINARFYGRFPYPWTPVKFDYLEDPAFETVMLNQNLGDWDHRTMPRAAKIWVAGCGTNQAVFTALRFPAATIIGSDVSKQSLELCRHAAKALNLSNLELREESLNNVSYKDQFDYVICTGVIHHNADPQATLAKLAGALKPNGIMELMVYNHFHWIIPVALQRAVRIMCRSSESLNLDLELSTVKNILNDLPKHSLMVRTQGRLLKKSEEALADTLMQPVLYNYTVESLEQMADSCSLELLVPCLNQFDKALGNLSWNMRFEEPALRDLYKSLPDTRRWQITNLLSLHDGPQLWFYLQRKNSGRMRKTEQQICEEFLDAVFARNRTAQCSYIRTEDGRYQRLSNAIPYPIAAPNKEVERVYLAADGKTRMREIFERLEIETSFEVVNDFRLKLTTSAFPYLRAVPQTAKTDSAAMEDRPGERERRTQESNYQKFKRIKPRRFTL